MFGSPQNLGVLSKAKKAKDKAGAVSEQHDAVSPAEDREAPGASMAQDLTSRKKLNGNKADASAGRNETAAEQLVSVSPLDAEDRQVTEPVQKKRKRKRDAIGIGNVPGSEAHGAESPVSDASRAKLQQWADKLESQAGRLRASREAMTERIKRAKAAANEVRGLG